MKYRITVAQADNFLNQAIRPLPVETCDLKEGLGRILRKPVRSDRPSPPYDRVMMDGVAICSSQGKATGQFQIVGESPAGFPRYEKPLKSGDAVGVNTGSVMPLYADIIIPVEDLEFNSQGVFIHGAPHPGEFLHPEGSDLASGEVVLEAGIRLNARDLSVAAGYGASRLEVSAKPKLGILTSGTELVEVSATPLPHQIRRSNDVAVAAMMQEAGFETLAPVHLPDDAHRIQGALAELLDVCDVLFVCGGISKGKYDYLPEALHLAGLTKWFHRVAQKPGGPFGFWQGESCQVFGLPGNPLSTFVCTARFGIPFVRAMCGMTGAFDLPTIQTASAIQPHPSLNLYKPYCLDEKGMAIPLAFQNSGDVVRPLRSIGLLSVPPSVEEIPAGQAFSCFPW